MVAERPICRVALMKASSGKLPMLVDAQAEVVELIAGNATLETTLDAVVGACERIWPGSDAAVTLHPPERDAIRGSTEPPGAASGVVIPIGSREGPTLGELVLHTREETPLPEGELAILNRLAQLARIALEQHRSELHLQRLIAEERRWIAGVLHDDPIQAMTAVNLRIQRLARHADPDLAPTIAELQTAVAEAIDRMRRLLVDLHPPTLDDEGLEAAIDGYFAEVLEPTGIECALDSRVEDEPSLETASLAYRLIAEALWNTAKHADASTVTVRIVAVAGGVDASIVDDGVGFDVTRPFHRRAGHMGISACRELAERASGSWTVESAPDVGTTVHIQLPGSITGNRSEAST